MCVFVCVYVCVGCFHLQSAAGSFTRLLCVVRAVGTCAGQVMVAGGYVVLERPNPALVAAVSARVYTVVAPLADAAPGGAGASAIEVEVISPQMAQSRRYTIKCNIESDTCSLLRVDAMPQNPYVEATLINTIR